MDTGNDLTIPADVPVSTRETGLPAGLRFGLVQGWNFIFRPKRSYAWMRRTYGDVVTIYGTPSGDVVLALTAEGAREVLSADPDGYGAAHKDAFAGLAGAGSLLILEGALHRAERKLLMPAFHVQNMRDIGHVIRDIVITHTDRLRPGDRIKALDLMMDISRDVILRVVFGVEDGPLLDEGRVAVAKVLHGVGPLITFVPAVQAWWFPPWRKFMRAKCAFSAFLKRCMAERAGADEEACDVLSLLNAARRDDGTRLSHEEILGEIGTIVLAGHKNMAFALSWALYELARHPAAKQRLRDELVALGADPDPNLIARQPYVSAVCDEALRLHPIHTEIGRVCRAPTKLLGCTIPTGTVVGVGICAIHQDPAIYPEPDTFAPDRFIERSYSPFEFLPFGGGHRRCIGAAFSDYQMRVSLATIVMRWELESLGEERESRQNLGMGPKRGVPMRVTGRRPT
ncbi:MAG: cytochrome P450 [Candidatus Hydrogenedentes bacterium]|nr:cytochrome P450 [Candidatus Hydrogenedentota bacterium]